ncbi:hypothetical protein LTR86_010316 [Recurvomyces mirabilis]|nr:hypothetical protein LTR86_010316 [Recurvomyces mirabilis]
MVHIAKARLDDGHFSTEEVRRSAKPALTTSRIIAFQKDQYNEAPNIAAGFDSLNISCEGPIRANLIANEITEDTFRIAIETWGDATLYSASTTWIEHKANAKQCIFGQYDTSLDKQIPAKPAPSTKSSPVKTQTSKKTPASLPQKCAKSITFPQPFTEPPSVICWLNRLDLPSGRDHDYKLRAFPDTITPAGFTAHLNTWDNGSMSGAAMCWIAFPASKRHVDSGRFSTNDVRKRTQPRERTMGRVRFGKKFEVVPTVLAALNAVDVAGNADLRVRVRVEEVSKEGFRWYLQTWGDSTVYSAGASWIALGFP